MSRLRIFEEGAADAVLLTTHDYTEIARELQLVGVRFVQWEA